jgi:hypothetical protein
VLRSDRGIVDGSATHPNREVGKVSRNTREIRLDPWKFAELIISKFKNNPLLLKKAVSHAFAEVVQS